MKHSMVLWWWWFIIRINFAAAFSMQCNTWRAFVVSTAMDDRRISFICVDTNQFWFNTLFINCGDIFQNDTKKNRKTQIMCGVWKRVYALSDLSSSKCVLVLGYCMYVWLWFRVCFTSVLLEQHLFWQVLIAAGKKIEKKNNWKLNEVSKTNQNHVVKAHY